MNGSRGRSVARTHQNPPTVRFYQLAALPLDRALVGVITKAWERRLAVCLLVHDDRHARWLDDLLWREPIEGFLPHGLWKSPDCARQPVLISLEPDERNGATVAVVATPKPLPDPAMFDLIIDFVHGQDAEAVNASRRRYLHYRDQGCTMEYWTQTERGRWQKK